MEKERRKKNRKQGGCRCTRNAFFRKTDSRFSEVKVRKGPWGGSVNIEINSKIFFG